MAFSTKERLFTTEYVLHVYVIRRADAEAQSNSQPGRSTTEGEEEGIFGLDARSSYLIILAVISLGLVVSAEWRNAEFFAVGVRASRNLHNQMFWNVVRSPVYFFDFNPVGIVLTRFSRDLGMVDEHLPNIMLEVFSVCLT